MKKFNEIKMEIDEIGIETKTGRLFRSFARFYWFMKNGLFSSSDWKWTRLPCIFNCHSWSDRYEMGDLVDENTMDLTLWCNRCHYSHKFKLFSNDLYYKLCKLIEVDTADSITLRESGVTGSNYELRKTNHNFIKVLEICLDKLKQK